MQQQIIELLKDAPTHVSGEYIADKLHMSRAAVWKHIDQLRHEGYEIVAVPHIGYKLESAPDKLLPYAITKGLKTKHIGHHVLVKDTAISTMDEAFDLSLANCPHGTVVCAETQTQGRGRLGRKWQSPKGKGLYFSVVLRPKLKLSQMPCITLLSAVALVDAIRPLGVDVHIKWPNDILVGTKKLAGILTEMRAEMDQVKFVVVGIGVNVNAPVNQIGDGAISLKSAMKEDIDRTILLQRILEQIELWLDVLQKKGIKPILVRWKKYSTLFGKRVRVAVGNKIVDGTAHDLGEDGSLLIRLSHGKIHAHIAGDVQVLS